jgi:hypothetical protein
MQFIEQPEHFATGFCHGTGQGPSTTVNFSGVAFKGGFPPNAYDKFVVQPGDYLEMFGGGLPYKINDVPSDTQLTLTAPQNLGQTATRDFRIYRQPRPAAGDELVTLPQNIVIDNSKKPGPNNQVADKYSLNVPARQIVGGNSSLPPYYEVMFSPSGGLLVGTSCGNVVLWVRDITVEPYEQNTSRLIAVGYRTGFIAGHPVAPGQNPWAYTQDGRASGF